MSSPSIDPQPPLQAAPPPVLPPAAPYVRLPKSPGLAAFLSLFPGLGHVYNGTIARAFHDRDPKNLTLSRRALVQLSSTGAVMPEGCDTVIPQERAKVARLELWSRVMHLRA